MQWEIEREEDGSESSEDDEQGSELGDKPSSRTDPNADKLRKVQQRKARIEEIKRESVEYSASTTRFLCRSFTLNPTRTTRSE